MLRIRSDFFRIKNRPSQGVFSFLRTYSVEFDWNRYFKLATSIFPLLVQVWV